MELIEVGIIVFEVVAPRAYLHTLLHRPLMRSPLQLVE